MNRSLPSLRPLHDRWAGAGLAGAATLMILAVSALPCWAAEDSPALYLGDQFEGGATARIAGMQVYQWIEYDKLENAKKALDEALTTKQRLRDGQWMLGESDRDQALRQTGSRSRLGLVAQTVIPSRPAVPSGFQSVRCAIPLPR